MCVLLRVCVCVCVCVSVCMYVGVCAPRVGPLGGVAISMPTRMGDRTLPGRKKSIGYVNMCVCVCVCVCVCE
jgi:hypothetical protein